jgi:hypothetical protein
MKANSTPPAHPSQPPATPAPNPPGLSPAAAAAVPPVAVGGMPAPAIQAQGVTYSTLASAATLPIEAEIPLWPAEYVDRDRFNTLLGDAHVLNWVGHPVEDIGNLFHKPVILDDDTVIDVETLKVPGFISISDTITVTGPSGNPVPAHEHIAQVLERDGLLICTFQWHKERYGVPLDTRQPLPADLFQEAFVKNEAHHAGAIVPGQRRDTNGNWMASFGSHNEPGSYHAGLYGDDGFVAVAHRLVFPEFVTPTQARGYTDSILCWLGLLNPFIKFPADYNGGDPTAVHDRATLKTLLKNGLLAALGDREAVAFLNDPANMTYCAEYMYINLNTVLYPFNQAGLTAVLDGDAAKAEQILAIQAQHNRRERTLLTQRSGDAAFERLLARTPSNPEFDAGNIAMPVVPASLPALDALMASHGHPVDPASLPFPPFTISHLLRRAFRVMLPRDRGHDPQKIAAAQARMMAYVEVALIQQLGLDQAPATDPRRQQLNAFSQLVQAQLAQEFESYDAFDQVMDEVLAQADKMLVGYGDRTRFVPPCIYIALGQQDGDDNLPQGWGFQLQCVGALISQTAVGHPAERVPLPWRKLEVQSPYLRGDDVKLLQGALIRAGYALSADGIYGPASAHQVKAFQRSRGLSPSGIIDHVTRSHLLKPFSGIEGGLADR